MDYPHSIPNVYLHDGKFTDGLPDGSIPPSRDPAKTQNDIIDSILQVQIWTGEAHDEDDVTQLARGIDARIAAAAPKGMLPAVHLVATAPISLSGLAAIDGVVPVAGDRVLAAGQADAVANGLYIAAAGAWARTADAVVGTTLAAGIVVPVLAGAQHNDSLWMLSVDTPVEIGTDATAWQRVGGDGLPLGSIIMHSGVAAPAGYLIANGAAVSRATYAKLDAAMYVGDALNATAPAWYRCTDNGNPSGTRAVGGAYLVLPDYRGVTLRGLDLGRGLDPDGATRVVNSYQADAYGSHKHSLRQLASGGNLDVASSGTSYDYRYMDTGTVNYNESTMPAGDAETRGKNTAVLICIKAFSAAANQGLIDITALANEMAGMVPYSAFTGVNQSKNASGYQKLPGGLIIQWGAATTSASGDVNVMFPVAYPSALFSVVATTMEGSGSQSDIVGVGTSSLTSVWLGARNLSGTRIARSIRWMSIGQ